MTILLLYKSHWRAHNLSCCLIASIGVYSRNVDQLSSPYLAILRASFGSDFTLRRDPAPLCLISNGFRMLTKIPSPWSSAATGSWYLPVASITTRVSGSMQRTFNARRDSSISECLTSYGAAKNLQYIMGHTSITITLDLYAHASEAGANREMRSLIAWFTTICTTFASRNIRDCVQFHGRPARRKKRQTLINRDILTVHDSYKKILKNLCCFYT